MKVTKAYLGRMVELVWRDPCTAHVKSHFKDHRDVPRGREVMAIQTERGIIDDVTDGVVRVVHTLGQDSPLVPDPTDDLSVTWVDESLVETITIYMPQPLGEEQPK